ncbi:MAG: 2Fe-2S iron-sulfur cluster binding domain-containing protein [Burkholderiaceae bacterium]|nr:2Fe-2S iron-sulfur cluster binding domain-containing protein [Burkholderiaceae bacterium]
MPSAQERYTVRIAGSETSFSCAGDDVLLRAAQRAGLAFPYECNVGSCGNCKFELLEGEVAMQWPDAPGWTDKDRQRGRFLGCQARLSGDVTIKLRPDARYAPVQRPRRMVAVLTQRRPITHDMEEFRFTLEQPQSFEPGQYALLNLPGVEGVRAYSMSNVPGDGSAWEFQVRRVPGGRGSSALMDRVHPGTRLEIDGPYGMAWLRRDAPRDILCLAGGSGLAPMLSIARAASAEPALQQRQLHFLYGARTPADVCGEDMLRALSGWGTRIHYESAVSAPPPGQPWPGATGFVHDLAEQRFGDSLAGMEIYFAGPPLMATAVQQMLLAHKVPFTQVHFDQFY